MIVINLFNERCQIDFNLSDPHVLYSLHSAIRDELSYLQPDAEWSPKYKLGQWDGKISLYNKKFGTFPIGLFPKVKNLLQNLNICARCYQISGKLLPRKRKRQYRSLRYSSLHRQTFPSRGSRRSQSQHGSRRS